jgi:macrodomain Ter protein organizer (MatP/YcbG family)
MTELKTKTIGLSLAVWKRLKHYTTEHDCSMSEAVERLLDGVKRKDAAPRTKSGAAG